MDFIITAIPMLSMQVFAEGGTGAAGGTAGNPGETAPAAGEQTVVTSPATGENKETAPDLDAEFESLIKDKFKDQYSRRVQDTVQKRLKGSKETEAKFKSLEPVLTMLGEKYGVDASDVDALSKAISDDDSLYEDYALEHGMSVQQAKQLRQMEMENESLKNAIDERTHQEQATAQYQKWVDQAEQARALYPSLDLDTEAQNPEFCKLLSAGIDVGSAYLVIHKDDVIPAAMQYTAKKAEQKVTNRVIANGQRPAENGLSSQGAVKTVSDVSKLSKAQRQELMARAMRGERITFGSSQ